MKTNGLILLSIISVALLIVFYCQRKDLAAYQAADSAAVASRMQWVSIRQHVPSEGYAGFLRAEKDRNKAYTTYWSSGNQIHYWSCLVPTFYVSIRYRWNEDTPEQTIVELDSADMVYFHNKAVSRLVIERRNAIQGVNRQYDTIESGDLWPYEDAKERWRKVHQPH